MLIKKSSPTPQGVHRDQILTNISIAYIQSHANFISDKVFPVVPVSKQSDRYYIYDKGDWFRDEAEIRAPSTETAGGGFNLSQDSYFCDVWGFHKDIDAQTRANADSVINLDRDATEFVSQRLMISRERQFVENYMQPGIWDNDWEGTAASPGATEFIFFDDYTDSDPIRVFGNAMDQIESTTGFTPNTCVMDVETWRILKEHPQLTERVKYSQRAVMTSEIIAPLLGVDRILIARGIYNTAAQGAADDMVKIHDNFIFIGYVEPRPALLRPSAGYTFAWTGYGGSNAYGLSFSRFDLPLINSFRVQGELAYAHKPVATDMAVFMENPIS